MLSCVSIVSYQSNVDPCAFILDDLILFVYHDYYT